MSIVNPHSTASASDSEGNSRTLTVRTAAEAPVAGGSATAAQSEPVTNPDFDVISVAELRRRAVLDALDPGPRPDAAARPRPRDFLSRIKSFYGRQLFHDTPADTENAERASKRGNGKNAENRENNGG